MGVSQLFHRSYSKAAAARTVYVLTRSTSQKAKISPHLGPQHEMMKSAIDQSFIFTGPLPRLDTQHGVYTTQKDRDTEIQRLPASDL